MSFTVNAMLNLFYSGHCQSGTLVGSCGAGKNYICVRFMEQILSKTNKIVILTESLGMFEWAHLLSEIMGNRVCVTICLSARHVKRVHGKQILLASTIDATEKIIKTFDKIEIAFIDCVEITHQLLPAKFTWILSRKHNLIINHDSSTIIMKPNENVTQQVKINSLFFHIDADQRQKGSNIAKLTINECTVCLESCRLMIEFKCCKARVCLECLRDVLRFCPICYSVESYTRLHLVLSSFKPPNLQTACLQQMRNLNLDEKTVIVFENTLHANFTEELSLILAREFGVTDFVSILSLSKLFMSDIEELQSRFSRFKRGNINLMFIREDFLHGLDLSVTCNVIYVSVEGYMFKYYLQAFLKVKKHSLNIIHLNAFSYNS